MLEALFDSTPLQMSDLQDMDSHELGLMNVVRLELSIVGLIPSAATEADRWKLKLFRWYQNTMLCIYIPVMAGQLFAIHHFWGDVDIVTDCAGMFFVFVACFFDYLYIIDHEKGILHVCETLENNPIPKSGTPSLIEKYLAIVEKCRSEIRIVMEIAWGLAAAASIKWLIYDPVRSLIIERHFLNSTSKDDRPNTEFVFIIWFPFDATWSPLFEIIYMFQSVLLVMAACHNICANSTFLTFMVHAWGRLQFVECSLSSMEDELNPKRVNNGGSGNEPEIFGATNTEVDVIDSNAPGLATVERILNTSSHMYSSNDNLNDSESIGSEDTPIQVSNYNQGPMVTAEDEPSKYLSKCIKQHQIAIEFVHELDELFSAWLGVRMFAFQMVAIGEVFQLIVNLDEWQPFVRHLVILFVTLSQVLMYCWFGEQVLQGGWDIDHAVYETPWYRYSQKYRKHLVLVIMRAHRPVEITVGHYYSLSLQSCELILQNIYFFSMFLNQINNKVVKQEAIAALEL